MRATKAYIAGLGTTGVLLAASILMLAVVSAVVAFDRWPDGHVSSRVQTLVLAERPTAIRVSTHASGPAATPAARRSATVAALLRAAGRAPVVAGERFTGGRRVAVALPNAGRPAAPSVPTVPKVPLPSPQALPDLI